MGPRARRRAARLAATLAVLAVAGAAAYHFAGPTSSNASRAAARYRIGAQNAGIPYGATPQQVLRRLGAPARKQAGCWLYRANHNNEIHGVDVGRAVDAMRFCFSNRVVSFIYSHYVAVTIHKRHLPAMWGPPINIEPHGPPQ
jgi:hypothetical protein